MNISKVCFNFLLFTFHQYYQCNLWFEMHYFCLCRLFIVLNKILWELKKTTTLSI